MQVLLLLSPWPHGPLHLPILPHNLLLILRLLVLQAQSTVDPRTPQPLGELKAFVTKHQTDTVSVQGP